jgi:hypothetical protein
MFTDDENLIVIRYNYGTKLQTLNYINKYAAETD